MPVKIENETRDDSIPVHEMRDGQIAVIAHWGIECSVGAIVERFGDAQIRVGMGRRESWQNIIANRDSRNRVRILPSGTTLTITEND